MLVRYVIGYVLMVLGAYIVFRVIVRRSYLAHGRLTTFPFLLQLLICGLYFNFPYLYLPARWPEIPDLPQDPLLRIPGLALLALGFLVLLVGMVSLGFRRVFGLGSDAVYRQGLYTICRNPQLVGGFILVVGGGLLWPSWYALGWVLLYLPYFHMMVLTEEEYLLQALGEDYRRYCAAVPRYLRLPLRPAGQSAP